MFVPLDVVEYKHDLVPVRQPLDGTPQVEAIDQSGQQQVGSADLLSPTTGFRVRLSRLLERGFPQRLLAQAHQHHVHTQPVQPSGESRFAAEGSNLAKQPKKGFLCQFFGLGCVFHHAQAQGIYTRTVQPVEALKCRLIALLGPADSFRLGQLFSFAALCPG